MPASANDHKKVFSIYFPPLTWGKFFSNPPKPPKMIKKYTEKWRGEKCSPRYVCMYAIHKKKSFGFSEPPFVYSPKRQDQKDLARKKRREKKKNVTRSVPRLCPAFCWLSTCGGKVG